MDAASISWYARTSDLVTPHGGSAGQRRSRLGIELLIVKPELVRLYKSARGG
jgi:hypothetical protein